MIRSISSLNPPVDQFIEGPCNCVNKILELNSIDPKKPIDIKDLVDMPDFSLGSFDS